MAFEVQSSKQFLKSLVDYVDFVETASKTSASHYAQQQSRLIDAMTEAQLLTVDTLLTDNSTEQNPWIFSQVDPTGKAVLSNDQGKKVSINSEGSIIYS